ncbi:MAG: sigma 54-interacting transcriptional regulator [Pseudomonadota bacterium]
MSALRLEYRSGQETRRWTLSPGSYTLGADSQNDLVMAELTVSRQHARLSVSESGALQITDLRSSNGTRVEGQRLEPGKVRTAHPGQAISFGDVCAVLSTVDADDLVAAVDPDSVALVEPDAGRIEATLLEESVSRFCLRELPQLLKRMRGSRSAGELGVSITAALGRVSPESGFVLSTDEMGQLAQAGRLTGTRREQVGEGPWRLEVVFDSAEQSSTLRQLAELALNLLSLSTPTSRLPEADPGGTAAPIPQPETTHPPLRQLYDQARRIAVSDIGVLIVGETGTGKEVLARFIHGSSDRTDGPLIALNCAALAEDLLEAELFGIEAGVATGVSARPGKFEVADQGTLLLDEIGDMGLNTQAKILRVLQEQVVHRVGGRKARPARVRVLAATNQPIAAMVQDGTFRRDLYHRIADWTVELPTLSHRRGDILNLAAHFLRAELERRQLSFGGISEKAARALRGYSWPGNVRELEREMKRCALFLSSGAMLESEQLQAHIREGFAGSTRDANGTLRDQLDLAEKNAIKRALDQSDGAVEKAANDLGIGRSTLYRRIKELGLDPSSYD